MSISQIWHNVKLNLFWVHFDHNSISSQDLSSFKPFARQAEIEHFIDPEDKSHPKFKNIKDQPVKFYSSVAQTTGTEIVEMSVGTSFTLH